MLALANSISGYALYRAVRLRYILSVINSSMGLIEKIKLSRWIAEYPFLSQLRTVRNFRDCEFTQLRVLPDYASQYDDVHTTAIGRSTQDGEEYFIGSQHSHSRFNLLE
jgi:hypothetical protein